MRVTDPADTVVKQPLPRQLLRDTEEAYHVACGSQHCDWAGLFPTIELGERAANKHLFRKRIGQDRYHVGSCTVSCTELKDAEARHQISSNHVYIGEIGPRNPIAFSAEEFGPWFPRSTGDFNALVQRGDKIELPTGDEGKVANIRKTRSCGIATWSVVYANKGTDLTRNDWQPRFKNELIAQGGKVFCRYTEMFPDTPAFKPTGQTEHQANFTEFAE